MKKRKDKRRPTGHTLYVRTIAPLSITSGARAGDGAGAYIPPFLVGVFLLRGTSQATNRRATLIYRPRRANFARRYAQRDSRREEGGGNGVLACETHFRSDRSGRVGYLRPLTRQRYQTANYTRIVPRERRMLGTTRLFYRAEIINGSIR